MSTANQQTLVESGSSDRPQILEKGSYVPWARRFLRFLDNEREGELMRNLINEDEDGVHLDEAKNDFMLDNAYGDNALEELNASVIAMARIQPTYDKSDVELAYDAEFISEVNASQIDMINGLLSKSDNEQLHHEKLKTIIHTSADEQIDYDIIFDHPIVHFGNDHFTAIIGYGDYVQGNLMICHIYYVEGLGHNLFSVGQFCDGDLEVAICSNICYVRNLEGEDLLTRSRNYNLYTIFISKMVASSLVCLKSKATSKKSWLWHRGLSHLNFGTINHLTKQDQVDGIPRFKYDKDHLCSACIFFRTKDETPEMIIKFINQIQWNMKVQVLKVRSDNETEFKNEKLRSYYENLGIMHQTSIAQMPQQNVVVDVEIKYLSRLQEQCLFFLRVPEFLWAEVIATTYFTQNHSLVHKKYNKMMYQLTKGRKPNVQYFHVFSYLCYPINDRDDLGKMKPKENIVIFIGYSESSRGFHI
uniref:Integrase, catalytic region, zinc finger, CCHC-type, peptidase aspartic, catalytic n=1 Tax=Tanacetum cinerariifolium TaxID=118510 RepID=A0A6L2KTZ4_TANCI|nr:integrase, catalytic region, zinc finger, CCHC-type, peptidase aspartic, catalytic [Tanacetum cinerariifolium]